MDEVILSRIRQEAYEQGYQDGKVDGYNLAGTQMSSAKQERKRGKWIPTHERLPFSHPDSITYVCSECGNKIYTVWGFPHPTDFCCVCGADMRGGTDG